MPHKKRIALCLLLFQFLITTYSENYQKQNVSVLPFSGWKGQNADGFQSALTNKIIHRIINSQRFNVIDRVNLERIIEEQNLQLSGVIDEDTVVQVGRLAGVQRCIIGNFTGNSVEYYPAKKNDQGEIIRPSYYESNVSATIRMLSVESGYYDKSVETDARERGENADAAFSKALDKLAESVVTEFESQFPIQTVIKQIDHSTVTIARGKDSGVKIGMTFIIYRFQPLPNEIFDEIVINDDIPENGVMKITSIDAQTAKGRLFGDFSEVVVGNLVRETLRPIKIEANILEKSFGGITVNAGADLGLTKGATFKVMKRQKDLTDPETGEVHTNRFKPVGTVMITEVHQTFSRGRIAKGRYFIRRGMKLEQTTPFYGWLGLTISYGMFSLKSETNRKQEYFKVDKWNSTITPVSYTERDSLVNRGYGHTIISMDYSNKDNLPLTGFLIQASAYLRKPISQISIGADFNYYNLGEESDLTSLGVDLKLSKHVGILPEILFLSPIIGFGFGHCQQKISSDIVQLLSEGNDDNVTAQSYHFIVGLDTKLKLGKLVAWANASYKTLSFTNWKYQVDSGTRSDDGKILTEDKSIDNKYVVYPSIKIPYAVTIGIAGEFDIHFLN